MSSLKYQSHDLDVSVNESEIINVRFLNNSLHVNKCFLTLRISPTPPAKLKGGIRGTKVP